MRRGRTGKCTSFGNTLCGISSFCWCLYFIALSTFLNACRHLRHPNIIKLVDVLSPTIQKRVAASGLAQREGDEELDMDIAWKVLSASNFDRLPMSATAAVTTMGLYSGACNGVPSDAYSPLAGDRISTTATSKFCGLYGNGSEVDDPFSSNSVSSLVRGVRHTPEEMRQLHLGHLYLVFDFVDTDLSKIIRSNQYMTKGHVQFILYQLLLGLKYMHSANVIHR